MTFPLARTLDSPLEHLARASRHWKVRDPVRWKLAPHRREAMQAASIEFRPRIDELEEAVTRHEARAIEAYDRLVSEAVSKMRAQQPAEHPWLARMSRALYADRPELLDDPSFPEPARVHVLSRLDKLNELLGIYDTFVELTLPAIERARASGASPVTLHDLAAGHAGFGLVLKERLGERVRVVASDIKDEYLELGRAEAKRRGLDLGFVVQDALSLGNLTESGVDVFTCTQTLHHFPPGMVARMIGEAARAARTGLVFIDAERSLSAIALLAPFALLYGRSYAFVHDTVTSLRRMYYEEELALLASLAPGLPKGARVETGFAYPGHAYLRITL